MAKPKRICRYCEDEPEPGWIETDNNGPIVPCPICNRDDDDRPTEAQEWNDYDRDC